MIVGDHVVRAEFAVLAVTDLALAVAGIREAGRREGEGGHEQTRQNPALLHLQQLPPDFRLGVVTQRIPAVGPILRLLPASLRQNRAMRWDEFVAAVP